MSNSYSMIYPDVNYGEYKPNYTDNTDDRNNKNITSQQKNYYCTGNVSLASKINRKQPSRLMKEFFSDENIKRIQRKIKKEIYKRSNGRFTMEVDQNEQQLMVVMEDIYENYAKNLNRCVIKQTKNLNNKLIDKVVPDMINSIKMYYGYMKDISQPIEPIARPINVNTGGRQQLPSVTTIWNA
jgi:hypothetical protein